MHPAQQPITKLVRINAILLQTVAISRLLQWLVIFMRLVTTLRPRPSPAVLLVLGIPVLAAVLLVVMRR
jgi:hypothetical protein